MEYFIDTEKYGILTEEEWFETYGNGKYKEMGIIGWGETILPMLMYGALSRIEAEKLWKEIRTAYGW